MPNHPLQKDRWDRRRFLGLLPAAAGMLLSGAACALIPPDENPDVTLIVSAEMPPYSLDSNGSPHGIAIDIAQELLRRSGQERQEIAIMPIRRAMTSILSGRRSIMVGVERGSHAGGGLHWISSLYSDSARLFSIRSDFVLESESSADYPVGVLAATPMEDFLKASGVENITLANDPLTLVRLLYNGRLAAVFLPDLMMRQAAIVAGYNPSVLHGGSLSCPVDLQIGASGDFSDAEIAIWRGLFASLKSDGFYDAVIRKYLA